MGADESRAWLAEHAHGTALADHRLLLDVEAYALHVRQYDFGRQKSTANVLGAGLRLDCHRCFDRKRAVRGADESAKVASHPQPAAQVAGDGAQVGPAPTADLYPRDRQGSGGEVKHASLVHLHFPGRRLRLFAAAREPVCALAVYLDRGESGRFLEDAPREMRKRLSDIVDGQAARIALRLLLRFGVVGSGRKAQVDVGDVCLGKLMGEIGEAGRGFEKDGQHTGGQRIKRARVADAMRAGQVSEPSHDSEGRVARGLVDIEDAAYELRSAPPVRASLRRHGSPPWPPTAPSVPHRPWASRSLPPQRGCGPLPRTLRTMPPRPPLRDCAR